MNVILIVETFAAFIVAITLHEAGHAAMALALGDSMAVGDGRLSLRPSRHLPAIGTMVAGVLSFAPVYAGIGWGKPVRFDSMRLRVGPNLGTILVAVAGPLVNLVIGVAVAAGLRFIPGFTGLQAATEFATGQCPLSQLSVLDPRLHGYGLAQCLSFLQPGWLLHVEQFLVIFAITSIALAIVNVLPLHPLDGYQVLFALLPTPQAIKYRRWEPQMEALLLIIFFVVPYVLQFVGVFFQPGVFFRNLASLVATAIAGPGISFAFLL